MKKVPYVIWQFWTGNNEMSPDRKAALATSANLGVEVKFLKGEDISKYELPEHRFHPAYRYLSCNHQSDYLRCYFSHFYGGGYADVKHYSKDNNWRDCIDLLNDSDKYDMVGQAESKGGAAFREWNFEPHLSKLICTSYFIMRPDTEFTRLWLDRVESILSSRFYDIQAHPATQARQREQGDYALRWLDVMGYPYHELCHSYFNTGRISRVLRTGRVFKEYI